MASLRWREQIAEIAGAHPQGGDGGVVGGALADFGAFVVGKEEELVLAVEDLGDVDGGAHRETVLIALEGRIGAGRIEEILGVQLLVAQELKGRAVEVVGAGFGGEIDDAAHGAAVLRGIGVGLHLELLDGVDGGLHHLRAPLGAGQFHGVIVEAVEQEVVLGIAHAAGAETGIARRR